VDDFWLQGQEGIPNRMNVAMRERWGTYVQESGISLRDMLKDHFATLKTRRVCFIAGQGFDPRMTQGIELVVGVAPKTDLELIVLAFNEGPMSPSRKYDHLVKRNLQRLESLVSPSRTSTRSIEMFSSEQRRITARSAGSVFRTASEFKGFTDICLDISSLPRSVFFPLAAKILFLLDTWDGGPDRPNFFVLVSENAELDNAILEEGVDEDADYIHPFRGGAERESTAGNPKVWFPLLGEGQRVQLMRIHELVNPDEICPLLPSPSMNPRRADDLVTEYRELLFDRLRVETRNFIFASETNPFEVYRQLSRAILHYGNALEPLGGSSAIISATSSKLLSIGAVLAAYELKQAGSNIAIAHIEAHGYALQSDQSTIEAMSNSSTLHGLWLSGECYAG
jgi:hypothetical protein